ncbi:MAG: thioredoxin domain-containing protein [Acidobacteria bacterium]|nr:thioredoxin domain-containing protein [Acidobacteriota bacterium]
MDASKKKGQGDMSEHKHTNRLQNETSPYLLQHAHNPVDWYPWGEEALAKAHAENKPILLSIGYSACHWCHVMERESFENEEIAALMNENFVNIKVDREERPDLDQIYMNAVQLMLGHGGWPLTVFLTPDLVPFYGGTYFPPEDRFRLPGFPRVVTGVADAYRSRPDEIAETTTNFLNELRRMNVAHESDEPLNPQLLDAALSTLARTYDKRHGGFGGAPKFPASMNLEFLLRTHLRTGDGQALDMVTHTCRKMAEGGLYDQLGGGFHRYSTDAQWLVPHFEKMLYDNALLSRLYLHAYQVTGDEHFRRIAEETFDYVVREMTDEGGAFYSTQDADSEGVEGKFFVWTIEEIDELLGEEDGRIVSAYYGATAEGNFEEKNILNVPRPAQTVAAELGMPVERLREVVERSRPLLFAAREKRIKPGRDEKAIAAWNGMMLTSFAEASSVLERADYRRVAERNADFLLKTLRREGTLLHVYKDEQAKHHAYLDDYACVASGLLSLYEATGAARWLRECLSLTEQMCEEFWDDAEGGFFYTSAKGEQLIVRNKDFMDNATPAGNSVAAELLLRLALLTENQEYGRRAVTVFRLLRDQMMRYPSAFGYLLGALDFYLSTPKEIVIIGQAGADDSLALLREVWKRYLPNKVVAQSAENDAEASSVVALLRDRPALGGRATAYGACPCPFGRVAKRAGTSPAPTIASPTNIYSTAVLIQPATVPFGHFCKKS